MSDPIPTAQQILASLREAGVPQRTIAEKLAVPQSAVSNLYNGSRMLKLHEANILLSLLPKRPAAREIPLIGMTGAGRWIEAIEEAREYIQMPGGVEEKGTFAVEVSGDSMNLLLPEGSYAVIDPEDRRLFNGKLYLLRNGEGEATIKRYRSDPARFEPVSDNPTYEPFEVGDFDFSIIGRVTSGVQKF